MDQNYTYIKDNKYKYANVVSNGIYIEKDDNIYGCNFADSQSTMMYYDGSSMYSIQTDAFNREYNITNSSYMWSIDISPVYNPQITYYMELSSIPEGKSLSISLCDGDNVIQEDRLWITSHPLFWSLISDKKFDDLNVKITPAFTGLIKHNITFEKNT